MRLWFIIVWMMRTSWYIFVGSMKRFGRRQPCRTTRSRCPVTTSLPDVLYFRWWLRIGDQNWEDFVMANTIDAKVGSRWKRLVILNLKRRRRETSESRCPKLPHWMAIPRGTVNFFIWNTESKHSVLALQLKLKKYIKRYLRICPAQFSIQELVGVFPSQIWSRGFSHRFDYEPASSFPSIRQWKLSVRQRLQRSQVTSTISLKRVQSSLGPFHQIAQNFIGELFVSNNKNKAQLNHNFLADSVVWWSFISMCCAFHQECVIQAIQTRVAETARA